MLTRFPILAKLNRAIDSNGFHNPKFAPAGRRTIRLFFVTVDCTGYAGRFEDFTMPKADGKTVQERFNERYTIDPVTGCWNWTAGLNGKGYAYIWTGPKQKGDTRQAYKVGWEFKNGQVPKGMELHHTCENTRCVNPDHLELLTPLQHKMKSDNIISRNVNKTECKNGHKFTPENTWRNKNGGRVCKTCQRNYRKGKVAYSL